MLYRISYILLLVAASISVPLIVHFTRPSPGITPTYVGSQSCGNCHRSPISPAYYEQWMNSPHARAYRTLTSDTAKAYLASHKDSLATCLHCHSTLGRPAVSVKEQGILNEGVGCESCHGPGSRYSFYSIMRDSSAFHSNAGLNGSLEDCSVCHTNSEHYACPFQRADFSAAQGWKTLRHPIEK